MTALSFERIISIDWSGADIETEEVDLGVALYDATEDALSIVGLEDLEDWSRKSCRRWLVERLKEPRPTLVAVDFGFGLPWNSDLAIFSVSGWRKMVSRLGALYQSYKTARATASAINGMPQFGGHGPYRIDYDRSDRHFYIDRQVGYYRLAELASPQAISQWYMGYGPAVAFHTITGLYCLDLLLGLRDQGVIDFEIWPHETISPDSSKHVLAESYPALTVPLLCPHCNAPYPKSKGKQRKNSSGQQADKKKKAKKKYEPKQCMGCNQLGPWIDPHDEDAWRVLASLVNAQRAGELAHLFRITQHPFGRYDGIDFIDQVKFEGYILGLG
ncbi:hypothetical protein [Tautonia plasticadhaerens]|uniref:DUF429 domain-containing protein n=1 Tax=Tautonia plasticadhaerens TaxID=2527974 RepID=A0A518H9Q8_9BACT|nr:hypothetical protein [Tautonia plasticadhaerens]QDV37588.1 hypothetical protein ElP_55280 [Tautonia plasticadhaerens]